jgi:hypothetical protein
VYAVGVVAVQLLTGAGPGQAPPPGELGELLARLIDQCQHHRPATATHALQLLRRLGVPPGAPWAAGPGAPEVVDRYGDPTPPRAIRRPNVPAYAWTVPAVFTTAAGVGATASWVVR